MAILRPRASRIAPSEAAAMPLPNEDTTPPVTNTKRVIVFARVFPSWRVSAVEALTTGEQATTTRAALWNLVAPPAEAPARIGSVALCPVHGLDRFVQAQVGRG